MKTISTEVFTLDELDDDAKEKAREWYREASAGDTFGAECVIDDAKECLKFAGWTIKNVYYSGFSSQGDGACFEGSWRAQDVNQKKMNEHAPLDTVLSRITHDLQALADQFPHANASVKQRGHYMNEMCTAFDFEPGDDDTNEVQALVYRSPEDMAHNAKTLAAEEELTEVSRDAMRWIYRQLETDWEYQNKDETVDDNIRANEYTFTVTGKHFG